MTDSRRRIGVCGLGSIGLRHARLLASRGGVALAVFDPAVPNDLPDEISTAARAASFEELLDLAPDGVVIATPDQFHAPLTIAACARRVPVLVEKPVADSLGAVDSMLSASETTGTPVLVGHVLRHTKALRLASGLLHGGAIGTPLSFHATVGAYETLERARSRFGSESFGCGSPGVTCCQA